ncbi:unnamed protein product [Paramecium sonneborni]|uniref:SCP domain-containing protein n=1 Tax=Paramecium sonneborni TaxID=65129 RepID=A0A8S1M756_9CILI|nr:unnamed protein product [Paramecium sonneborni]
MDFEKIAQEVFEYQNQIRMDPTIGIAPLEARLKYFKGNILHMPGQKPLQYKEGAPCVQECIDFLKAQPPLPPLQYEKGLELSARDHGIDLGKSGTTGHTGTDGSNTSKRISRYGLWKPGPAGQNISYGKITGQEVLLQLIVDDGKPDRGHRHNVFEKDYKLVGVYVGEHIKFKYITVMDYSKKFTMKGQKKQKKLKQESEENELIEDVEKINLDEQEPEDIEQNVQIKEGNLQGEDCIELDHIEQTDFQQELQQEQQEQQQQQEQEIEETEEQQEQQEQDEQNTDKSTSNKIVKPAGCIKIVKKIKQVNQNGVKMKQITCIFKMKDGTEQKQIILE